MITEARGPAPRDPGCADRACSLQDDAAARCWLEPEQHCHRPLDAASFGDLVQRHCAACPVLEGVRVRARGRRRADRLAEDAVARLGREIDDSARSLADAAVRLRHTLDELSLVQEVSLALGAARDRDEIAGLLLAGVTAGEGYGLNRAFLLVREGDELRGLDAVGPGDANEAARLYADLAGRRLGLEDLLHRRETSPLRDVVRGVRIACDGRHPLARRLAEGRPCIVRLEEHGALEGLPDPAPVSLVAPLVGGEGAIGLLVADNLYTARDPGPDELTHVASLASQAAVALERVVLQERLGEKARELRGAVRVLGDSGPALEPLGEIATHVLHGLKNSLVVIGGHARQLERRPDRSPVEERSLRSILAEVEHLEDVVGTLLEAAAPEARSEDVDVRDLTRRAAGLERVACEKADVRLVEESTPSPATVSADPDLLLLALRNVLQNARDATPAGGEVQVRTAVRGDLVVVEIEDTGPGLASEVRERAGQPFFTTKRGGTGLGLWLARRVLRRHGGSVHLEDAAGGGLAVRLELPAHTARAGARANPL